MKLATLGLATALAFTSSFASRAVQRRLGKRKLGHGRRGNERHDDRISRQRDDIRQCNGYEPQQLVSSNSAGSLRRKRRGTRHRQCNALITQSQHWHRPTCAGSPRPLRY